MTKKIEMNLILLFSSVDGATIGITVDLSVEIAFSKCTSHARESILLVPSIFTFASSISYPTLINKNNTNNKIFSFPFYFSYFHLLICNKVSLVSLLSLSYNLRQHIYFTFQIFFVLILKFLVSYFYLLYNCCRSKEEYYEG